MITLHRYILAAFGLGMLAPSAGAAEPAPFDLAGPALKVSVSHGGATLPIAEVPNLAEGDRVSIKADLPADQSAHYVLIAAFLRGATNPPPEKWFSRAESWTRKGRTGLDLVVPAGARQLVLFMAPETGGDFPTLRNAVRAQPGAFVRASQDLNQASLDRSRLDAFLHALQPAGGAAPDELTQRMPQLASALAVKLNPACLEKMPELQAPCLMQNQDALLLNDGHSNALTDTLTGPGADLALQFSATPQGGLGYYSPYIGAIRDIVGIFGSLHTAKYQYIPALKTESGDRIGLVLNAAPSFRNPKSVLVTTLPAIAPPRIPPLRLAQADLAVCTSGSDIVVPVTGAPLIFSTQYLHDTVLRVRDAQGKTIDLRATPDVERGGFVVSTKGLPAGGPATGLLHGLWGFQPYDGPTIRLQRATPGQWQADEQGRRALIVGRADPLLLSGGGASCVESVNLRLASGETKPVEWKVAGPDRITLTVPLADAEAGDIALLVRHAGLKDPDIVALRAFAEASRLDGFALYAGDASGLLSGRRLDQVASLSAEGVTFRPGALNRTDQSDALTLDADKSDAGKLTPGQRGSAKVQFRDGRSASVAFRVAPARPQVAIVARSFTGPPQTGAVAIRLTGPTEVPAGATLAFSLRMASGKWTGGERVEIARADADSGTELTLGKGLTLQDAQVAVATLDTNMLPPSTFGGLKLRVQQGGLAGDWQPFVTLLRLPKLHQLTCPAEADTECELSGDALYLIQAIGSDPALTRSVSVPDGYVGTAIKVPHPTAGTLYLRLRDNPDVINQLTGAGGTPAAASIGGAS